MWPDIFLSQLLTFFSYFLFDILCLVEVLIWSCPFGVQYASYMWVSTSFLIQRNFSFAISLKMCLIPLACVSMFSSIPMTLRFVLLMQLFQPLWFRPIKIFSLVQGNFLPLCLHSLLPSAMVAASLLPVKVIHLQHVIPYIMFKVSEFLCLCSFFYCPVLSFS